MKISYKFYLMSFMLLSNHLWAATDYQDFENKHKDAHNRLIIKKGEQVFKNKEDRQFLMLDAENQRSTQMILDMESAEPDQIRTPQIDKDTFDKMNNNKAKVSFESVHNLLKRLLQDTDKKFPNIIYLDYMGSATGNKSESMFPFEDVELILKRRFHDESYKKIVLAITFCKRTNDLPEGYSTEKAIKYQLEALFNYYGFKIKKKKVNNYSRTPRSAKMVTLFYHLEKIEIDENPPFLLSKEERLYTYHTETKKGYVAEIQTRVWGFQGTDVDWIRTKLLKRKQAIVAQKLMKNQVVLDDEDEEMEYQIKKKVKSEWNIEDHLYTAFDAWMKDKNLKKETYYTYLLDSLKQAFKRGLFVAEFPKSLFQYIRHLKGKDDKKPVLCEDGVLRFQ